MKDNIQSIIRRRGITNLIHFTHPVNIKGIEKYGLKANRELHGHNRNDPYRFDKWNGVCLSVTRPNIYLLNAFINKGKLPNPTKLIVIDSEVILYETSLFFDCNAASSKFRQDAFYSYNYLKSAEAFESMFADKVMGPSRNTDRKYNHRLDWTTDYQAEIIVEKVPSKYIKEIQDIRL